ncbi:hypothetical protein Q8F55_004718 [Vanrija albida]|uniref:Uncharacterized protein n=1 Tax=Vanrija albida TaxID=181172 RepID=A0ABR3PZW3_9TREE
MAALSTPYRPIQRAVNTALAQAGQASTFSWRDWNYPAILATLGIVVVVVGLILLCTLACKKNKTFVF